MSNDKLAPLMTYTGPAGRIYHDADGNEQVAGENEIRADYDPDTGRYRGLFIDSSEGDDARFTDPAVFNDFERGTFVVEFETQSILSTNNYILSRGSSERFLYLGPSAVSFVLGGPYSLAASGEDVIGRRFKYAISYEPGNPIGTAVNGVTKEHHNFDYSRGSDALQIGELAQGGGWSGWIRALPFNPEVLTPEQLQRATAVPRRTTIASGTILGDYDPNERLSLFTDRHGIHQVERDGDPVRFMLDLGPAGNHLQAAPESTGLIYRTDGERAWIEYNGVNDYFQYRAGPILRGDISVSTHVSAWRDLTSNSVPTPVLTQRTQSNVDFYLYILESGNVAVRINKDTGIYTENIQTRYTAVGAWTNISLNEVSTGFDVHQNGELIYSKSGNIDGNFGLRGPFRIGYDGYQGRYWKGRLGRITLTADAAQADRDALDAEIIDRYVSA